MTGHRKRWRAARAWLLGAVASGRNLPRPWRWLAAAVDRRDERRAGALRSEAGRREALLSWRHDHDGLWTARLSGPDLPRTLERRGPTRADAVERALESARRIQSFRAERFACGGARAGSRPHA